MTHKISELKDMKADEFVTICGLITTARQIPTKKDPTKFLRFMTLEDLTGKVEIVCFNNKLAEYGEMLQPEQKVIISGKVQHRDEDQTSVIIDSVKTVENSNLVTVNLLDEFKYEELCALKNILVEYHGSDPVVLSPCDEECKILTASMFWVNSSNDMVNKINHVFKDKVAVSIKSMDKD